MNPFCDCWQGDSETFGETKMLHASIAHFMNLPCTTRHHGDAGVGDTGEKGSLSLQVVGGQLGVPRDWGSGKCLNLGETEWDHDCKQDKYKVTAVAENLSAISAESCIWIPESLLQQNDNPGFPAMHSLRAGCREGLDSICAQTSLVL